MNLSAIGIPCKDIQKSLLFYKELGLEFIKYSEQHFETKPSNGTKIMLDSYDLLKELDPHWKEPINPSIVLGFEQQSPNDVDRLFEHMTQMGHRKVTVPWDAPWGQRYCNILDPDGNQIDIYAEL